MKHPTYFADTTASERMFAIDHNGTATAYPFVVEWQIDRDNTCEVKPLFDPYSQSAPLSNNDESPLAR